MTYFEAMEARAVHRGFRFAICKQCGERWNISRKRTQPDETYLCPRCRFPKYENKEK